MAEVPYVCMCSTAAVPLLLGSHPIKRQAFRLSRLLLWSQATAGAAAAGTGTTDVPCNCANGPQGNNAAHTKPTPRLRGSVGGKSTLSHGAARYLCTQCLCSHCHAAFCAAMTSSTPRSQQQPCSKAGRSRWPERAARGRELLQAPGSPARKAGGSGLDISRQGVFVQGSTHSRQPNDTLRPAGTLASLHTRPIHATNTAASSPTAQSRQLDPSFQVMAAHQRS